MRKPKVMIISLDSATFDLIEPWVKEGKLPTFKKLMEEGTYGDLTSTLPPYTCPAWPSFMTGKNPGKCGVFDFIMYQRGIISIVNSRLIDGKKIWNILSEYYRKVGVVNVPVTYPPEKVNGFMITGILSPDGATITYPPNLLHGLDSKLGEYRVAPRVAYRNGSEHDYIEDVYELADIREKYGLYLMDRYDWDFFMLHFHVIDEIQHFFWKFIDPTHPEYTQSGAKDFGNVISEIYQKMDTAISRLSGKLDDDTTLIIISDHGHGPLHKVVNLNNFLMKNGFMFLKNDVLTRMKYGLFKAGVTPKNAFRLLSNIRLGNIMVKFSKQTINRALDKFLSFTDVDWSRTKAYSIGYFGQVHINLKGREPHGIVEPGKEYEEVRNQIIKELYELEDPETNEKIVDEVIKKEDVYTGKYLIEAPDLLVKMMNMKYLSYHLLAEDTSIVTSAIQSEVSGSHRLNGIFIARGPSIKRGWKINNAELIDVAPTILHLFGLPVPDDMDGKVLTDIFEPSFMELNPIRYEKTRTQYGDRYEIPDEETEVVKERLRSLGYF
ncbi:MAG: alkaline phosphatase family protein [Candidatus Hodarchaeota archaeon]